MGIHTSKAKRTSPCCYDSHATDVPVFNSLPILLGDFVSNTVSKLKLKIWIKALKIIFLRRLLLD